MKVGIAGAGSIAFATAALLHQMGHAPMLWSPSGAGTEGLRAGGALRATGAIETTFTPALAGDACELASECDVIVLAIPGYGHKAVMDSLIPCLRAGQPVIISSHASFGALYLADQLKARGIDLPVTAWGTTVVTGRKQAPDHVQVNTVRSLVDLCTVPAAESDAGKALCEQLFGERFNLRDGLLAITLSNLNPQNHMGIALANATRMEKGETWGQGEHVTPNVGRLLEALDRERLAIADKLGLPVRTIFEHFHLSFHVPVASISEMNQQMHELGRGGMGPATADSRYVTEDVPFGLAVTVALGRMSGCPAVLHQAGVEIFSAMYGRDFFGENDLLPAIGLERMNLDDLCQAASSGRLPEGGGRA
ncbi:NAD/NADP-dependent octopine/nopaline dehydrogenase family protein [Labrenzia sp. 011]|uniref:NAD/NADP-dependent octopine/nopaline dehydrogenase family protein n=1 Tax=Labrenzia sp. 011 TaxID=2171494 RepID=UPI001AD8D12A|nr:NAD/NADP-dependent octopine/nopaline dehydrogenase family protein [Labrenzia sp. 011]